MGYALLFPTPTKLKRKGVDGFSDQSEIKKGHWQNLVSNARAVLRYTPEVFAGSVAHKRPRIAARPAAPAAPHWQVASSGYVEASPPSTGFLSLL